MLKLLVMGNMINTHGVIRLMRIVIMGIVNMGYLWES